MALPSRLLLLARREIEAAIQFRDNAIGILDVMASIHIVDRASGERAEDAIRDILYLYRDLVAYGGVVGDHNIGSFDPWEFLQATRYGWSTDEDLKLLHEGSSVALLCDLLDEMEQRGGKVEPYRLGLDEGRFADLPLAQHALRAGLEGPRKLREASRPVYEEYVLGYLLTLVE